jgi:hypothetical protein
MSIMLNGARYAVATALSAVAAITDISNTAPPVASAAAPPAAGSILLLSSGWGDLDEAPVRSGVVVAGESFELEGYDSTDLARFPAGEGVGGFYVASDFINLPKIHEINATGGEQNYATRQYVSDPTGKQVQAPTFKSARNQTYMMDYDPTKPHFNALIELDRNQNITILRETLKNGDVIYYAGRVSFNKEPTKALNEFISNAMAFSPTSDSIRYAAAP